MVSEAIVRVQGQRANQINDMTLNDSLLRSSSTSAPNNVNPSCIFEKSCKNCCYLLLFEEKGLKLVHWYSFIRRIYKEEPFLMKPRSRLVKAIDPSLSPSLERPLSSQTLAVVTMHERPVKPSAGAKMPKSVCGSSCFRRRAGWV